MAELSKVQLVIGLMGPKQAGKDTVAQYAIEQLKGAGKIATASALKDLCSKVFHMGLKSFNELKDVPFAKPMVLTTGQVRAVLDEMRARIPLEILPLEKFKPWGIGVQKFAGRTFKTPRALLQYIGTELMQSIYKPFHCVVSYNQFHGKPGTWFITDMRFLHEAEYAAKVFPLFYPVRIVGRNEVVDGQEEHPSESEWKKITPFATIDNSKEGLDYLYQNSLDVFKTINEDAQQKAATMTETQRKPAIPGVTKKPKFIFKSVAEANKVVVRDMDDLPEPVIETYENDDAFGRRGEKYERHR